MDVPFAEVTSVQLRFTAQDVVASPVQSPWLCVSSGCSDVMPPACRQFFLGQCASSGLAGAPYVRLTYDGARVVPSWFEDAACARSHGASRVEDGDDMCICRRVVNSCV